jgi:DNA replication protein DnaC
MDLARRLTAALEQHRLPKELNNLGQPTLLIVDEVGYLRFDAVQASLLFQVICRRYEKAQATVLTSNKAFGDWGDVFAGDAVLAAAALDRLLHRCTVLNIRGESYRLRDRRQASRRATEEVMPPAP